MILVVALLGILFVAGAAFLQSVTFQARTVRADKEERAVTAGLEAVHALSRELLTRRWLDGDGMPYVPPPDNPATSTVDESRAVVIPGPSSLWPYYLQAPAYGVSLGLDPLLASTEPFENTDEGLYTVPTDLNRALLGFEQPQMTQPDIGAAAQVFRWATRIDRARAQWAGAANYQDIEVGFAPQSLADADGDGVADSVVVVIGDPTASLTPELAGIFDRWFPATLRETLAEQLRASDVPPGDNRLYLSLRVIDHGSMVNATCTHPYLVNEIINDWNDPPLAAKFNHGTYLYFTPTAYRPEIEERALRYRNILPARSLARTALHAELRGFRYPDPLVTEPLLYAWSPAGGIGGSLDSHRWWPFDPGLETGSGLRYRILFDAFPTVGDPYPPHALAYNRRHLLTTVSYDDLLIRGVRFPDHADLGDARNRDIVGWMRAGPRRSRWAYPADLFNRDPGDPRLGRLQLSIPDLEKFLTDRGATIDNLHALSETNRSFFIGYIYDTFWLMLWNHPDLDGDGEYKPWKDNGTTPDMTTDDWQRARLAASLTANFIDFADSNDEPTYIPLFDMNGDPVPGHGVFGIERQPYITEVYTKVVKFEETENVAASSVYAIELYNPYDVPIDLSGYELTDRGSGTLPPNEGGTPLTRMSDIELSGITAVIPPRSFQVYFGYGTTPSGVQNAFDLPDSNIGFDQNSEICLVRKVTIDATEYKFDVDRVERDITDVNKRYVRTGFGTPAVLGTLNEALSVQRDTSMDGATPPNSHWRFVVPRVTLLADSATGANADNIHTLGEDNAGRPETIDPTIRPVQIDFPFNSMQTGSLTAAYPTTGTLLLLMRLAHEYDASQSPVVGTPYNHMPSLRPLRPEEPGLGLAADFDQIDNGRMPVFDVGEPVASPGLAGSKPYYHKLPESRTGKAQGVEGLPWGQFVFDYFTTLPLYRQWERDEGFEQPAVDQGGLRVRGRINIGTAPWKVLAGLPLRPLDQLPVPFQPKLAGPYSRDSYDMSQAELQSSYMRIGHELAKAIVAYRDAREVPHDCNVGGGSDCSYDYRDRVTEDPSTQYLAGMRQGRGFLTVGELANIRRGADAINSGPDAVARFDYGLVGSVDAGNPEDYVKAVALLVGLGDWVTTRSHVFTIYGTLRGPDTGTAASIAEADAKAIRFEETVNRLPAFFNTRAPLDRIGERFVGKYEEARAD